ncbi:ABC transporter permease [Nocardioides sp. zg-579]|uniref:ABC transporter permease n=1 Tax=Nocardioides marmotae TaxID=2663857 RepID=A0A6I3JCQ8_9ACTN|nr:ABC transporter permease [Nocardioides marmotae]MCR6032222.1 ABC transporter permease [Gordonia jinghuaiqii]MTB95869.1 ABC transporter permease [Nocardioides marmotae]QKE02781.1 ABC transporter permease [Nocardioides marmotae]
MSINLLALIGAMLTIATPLVWAGIGELITERSGVLNLSIEGTMYLGAFIGFLAAARSGSPWIGLLAAVVGGVLAGALMGFFVVTLGLNQHVSGLGLTLLLIAICEFTFRLLYAGDRPTLDDKFRVLFRGNEVLGQHWLTYVGFLVLAPAAWWVLRSTGLGMRLHAVGESFEAADVAGISVTATRYVALMVGSALMAIGGAFLTLAVLGSFTLDIVSGRGWVCIALVIFARWRVWPAVLGALIFAGTDALQLQLAITSAFDGVPGELMLALPYLAVIAALAIGGRTVRYPGSYLKAYRRA